MTRSLLWSTGTILAAALVAYGVSLWTRSAMLGAPAPAARSFHDWLHENLEITPEQERLLLPHETSFERQSQDQQAKIEAAGQELANAIRRHAGSNPEVETARQKLLDAQGELQQITLAHFFAMKEQLDPEQGEKLLQWTHDSILYGPQP